MKAFPTAECSGVEFTLVTFVYCWRKKILKKEKKRIEREVDRNAAKIHFAIQSAVMQV